MTKKKSTKRALLMSALSLMMCVTMFVGSTFAWFTDTVTSAGNIIKSGKLDITMEWADGTKAVPTEEIGWTDASTGAIFKSELWEPGYTEVRHIKIANEGTLALKYQLNIVANGAVSKLADVIDVYYVDPATQITERTELTENMKLNTLSNVLAKINTTASGELLPGQAHTITIALKMQESADNKYQDMSIGSDFSVQLLATQLAAESDSFDNQYDIAAAPWTGGMKQPTQDNGVWQIGSADELAWFAQYVNGKVSPVATASLEAEAPTLVDTHNAVLTADINLNNIPWTPIGRTLTEEEKTAGIQAFTFQFHGAPGKHVVFDGQGHTVYNVNVNEKANAGLFGAAVYAAIKNVNVVSAEIRSNHFAGAILAQGYAKVENCHVKDATVTCTTEIVDGSWDNGDKVGGVVGKISESGNNGVYGVVDCSAENVTVSAYRDAGGILGYAGDYADVTGNKITNVTMLQDNTHNYKGYTKLAEFKVNAIVGDSTRATGVKVENNSGEAEVGRSAYSLKLVPNEDANTGTIFVSDKEGLLSIPALVENWVTLFSDGQGTAYSNYEVKPFYYNWTWKIVLESDIDFAGEEISPINLGQKGGFDGQGHTISNAKIVTDATTENEAGLFIANSCAMSDLKLNNIQVTGSNVGNSTAGILSGSCNAAISNITIENSSVTGGKYTGGIVGYGYTDIINCSVTNCTVKGGYKLGGLIGYICSSNNGSGDVISNTLTNCTVDGIGSGIYAGGKDKYIVGKVVGNYNTNGICRNNTVTDMTTSATANIGEIEANKTVVESMTSAEIATDVADTLVKGDNAILTEDLTFSASDTAVNSGYGAAGIVVSNGAIFDGNGNTLTVENANNTWDCAVNVKNGTVKNVNINGAFRGIFMSGADGDVYIDNVVLDDVVYTFNSDAGNKEYGVYISNSTLNGWTSFSDAHKEVVFTNCKFGEGSGYAFCRPYNAVVFENCVFEEGYEFDTSKTADITFKKCYYGDTLITAENAGTLALGDVVFVYNGVGSVSFE